MINYNHVVVRKQSQVNEHSFNAKNYINIIEILKSHGYIEMGG